MMEPFDLMIVVGALLAIMLAATPLMSRVEPGATPVEAHEVVLDRR